MTSYFQIHHGILRTVVLGLVLLGSANVGIQGQECERVLRKAESNYDNGQLREIPGILSKCLTGGFNKTQREKSYKLLVLTYIFLDDIDKAEEYLLKLLKSNPQFEVSQLDPPEFIYLYNGFRTKSYFSIAIKGGMNNTFVNALNINGVGNIPLGYQRNSSKMGYQVGLGINFRIWENFEVSAEFNIVNRRFNQIDSLKTTFFTDVERPLGYNFSIINASESQIWVGVPLMMKYSITQYKMQPFIYGGVSMYYLLGANLNVTRFNIDPSDVETPQRAVTGPSVKLLRAGIREKYHYSLLAGAGFKYKVGTDYLMLDFRYYLGINNLRNEEAALDASNELVYRYGYIDNDFTINGALISIGYVKPFYRPKKLRKKL